MLKKIEETINKYKTTFIFILAVLSNLVIYLFFIKDLNLVCRYLDGPHYLEVAKTFYQRVTVANPAKMPEWYFSVHLIAFPFSLDCFFFPS